MKSLRIRFALGFSALFFVFLTIAFLTVYLFYVDFRQDVFYSRLKDKALTTFKLLIEVEQIDHDLLQVIDKNTLNSLYNEKVLIFEGGKIIYSSIDDHTIHYNARLLEQVKQEKEIYTTEGEDELAAFYVEQNGRDYFILVEAFDKYGKSKTIYLMWVMIVVYFTGLAVGGVVTFFFVKRVIKPLEVLKKNIQNISSANLDTRLKQDGQGEEVDSLASNFNQMLERLQQSFSIQKNFVHYASHELRTPLTAMIGITENALKKKLDETQYAKVLEQLYQQQQNFSGITNSLLILSDNKIIGDQTYPKVRLDELLFRSVEIMQNLFPVASIQVNLEGIYPSEDSLLINANEPLLLMAFNNLLKNALQYSGDNRAAITIRLQENAKTIEIRNTGRPIAPDEELLIFTPFYRATNANQVKGHGLGLPLAKQIADLHSAALKYYRDNELNVFSITFYETTK